MERLREQGQDLLRRPEVMEHDMTGEGVERLDQLETHRQVEVLLKVQLLQAPEENMGPRAFR